MAARTPLENPCRSGDALYTRYGIPIEYELHATKFVNNRGWPAGPGRRIFPPTRLKIFRECLAKVAGIPDVRIFNTLSREKQALTAFERLLNRLQAAAKARREIVKIYCDQGKESKMDRLFARLRKSNHIPSSLGGWIGDDFTKHVSLDNIDPSICYLDSRDDHFIQAADFCAYSMLRWKAEDLPNRTRGGLHKSFKIIEPVFEKRAFRKDPHGIIQA